MSIITKFRSERSLNGYSLDVLKSGLQKYIRRSILDKALYCAGELDLFADAGHDGERVRTNFIHRLMIIYLEDISIGNYHIFDTLHDSVFYILKNRKLTNRNRKQEILEIKKIVTLLVESKKTRIGSHVNNFTKCFELLKGTPLENIFLNLMSLEDELRNKTLKCVIVAKQYDDAERAIDIFKALSLYIDVKIPLLWYKEIKTKERFLTWLIPLLYYLYGSDGPNSTKNMLFDDVWDNQKMYKIDIDDYVMDKHTHNGIDKTTKYFAETGAYVFPESTTHISQILKTLYESVRSSTPFQYKYVHDNNDLIFKTLTSNPISNFIPVSVSNSISVSNSSNNISNLNSSNSIFISVPISKPTPKISLKIKTLLPLIDVKNKNVDVDGDGVVDVDCENNDEYESKYFEFVSRIQLVTSHSRCDTYYAKRNNKLFFVKGPFFTTTPIDNYLKIQDYKKMHNIPFIHAECIYLYPDLWSEGIPLGIRNKVTKNKKYAFMVCESIIPLEKIVFRDHSSKLWPVTKVIDPVKTKLHVCYDMLLDKNILYQYFNLLSVRIIFGCSDLADRNFLIKDNILYSIDEEIISSSLTKENVLNELKTKKFEYLKANLENCLPFIKAEFHDILKDIFI